jgi:hypothetical protein
MNMKLRYLVLSLAIAVIAGLTVHGIAQGQTYTYTAYSVANVQQTANDAYTATVDVVNAPGSKMPIPSNGSTITILTVGCKHVPAKGGENGIVVNGPRGLSLLFASGATCTVTSALAAN